MLVQGWHFCEDRLGSPVLRDGSPCPSAEGIEHVDGTIKMCLRGLHWSVRALDALEYAQGPWARLVEGEPVAAVKDKVVSHMRKTLAGPINAERMLRGFAALCALRALRLYANDTTRNACMPAVRCALTYWRTGVWPEDRATAWDATRTAGLDAALAAASAAAWNDAWDTGLDATWAAWNAARNAALAAASAGACNAACAAGLDAERVWQNRLLEAMLVKALEVRP